MSFNFQELLQRVENLDFLIEPFTHEEIDSVVPTYLVTNLQAQMALTQTLRRSVGQSSNLTSIDFVKHFTRVLSVWKV
jgi:hypothetical protein